MTRPVRIVRALLLTVPALAWGAGCGGGSSPLAATPATAQAALFLTDAPPVTIADNMGVPVFEMKEMWLTLSSATLEGTASSSGPLALVLTGPIDVMTLDTTSSLFALGSFPAGTYEEVTLTVDEAVMVGVDLTGAVPTTGFASLQLGAGRFEVPFQPGPAVLDPATPTPLVIDWQPAVSAERDPGSGSVTYALENQARAFSTAASGGPVPLDVDDLEGTLASADCAGGLLTLERGGANVRVATSPTTAVLDAAGAPLAGGCAGLALGAEVEVQGTLQPNGMVLASRIAQEGALQFEQGGKAEAVTGIAFVEFDLRVGTTIVVHVVTDPNTRFAFDDHHRSAGQAVTPGTDIANGAAVEVEGSVTGGGNVPTVLAAEVEIR